MTRVANIRHRSGFSLIEVLVAIFVLSLGLIGMAALTGIAVRTNHGAHLRSQATNLGYDIMEQIRANRRNATQYAIAFGAAAPTTSTVSARDLQVWTTLLADALPGGQGQIVVAAVPGTNVFNVTVSVRWTDSREQTANRDTTFALTSRI
jgi:type IV pilus assembly protein PilV